MILRVCSLGDNEPLSAINIICFWRGWGWCCHCLIGLITTLCIRWQQTLLAMLLRTLSTSEVWAPMPRCLLLAAPCFEDLLFVFGFPFLACHVFECEDSQYVLTTIGQAFELRYKMYLQNPQTRYVVSAAHHVSWFAPLLGVVPGLVAALILKRVLHLSGNLLPLPLPLHLPLLSPKLSSWCLSHHLLLNSLLPLSPEHTAIFLVFQQLQ